nr:hypothetical protein [Angustibacter aerolatus]
MLGFDSYADLSSHLGAVLHGERPASHAPRDRRRLLPLSPATRQGQQGVAVPGHGQPGGSALPVAPAPVLDLPEGVAPASGPRVVRRRLDGRPWAPLKIASGCDRRCAFCAIPSFRGAFLSRRPADVLTEARWLAEQGVREPVPGERELHLVRQGPRRPAAARDDAARAWPRSTASTGCGCRTCSPPRCGPACSRR